MILKAPVHETGAFFALSGTSLRIQTFVRGKKYFDATDFGFQHGGGRTGNRVLFRGLSGDGPRRV
jgi:hypothetical protein